MSCPQLPPSEGAVAATPGSLDLDYGSVAEALKQLLAGQSFQTELLQKLHKTVLTSRSIINELVVANNELKEELQKIKGGPPSPEDPSPQDLSPLREERPQKKRAAAEFDAEFAAQAEQTVAGHTPDEEIDVILAERRRKGTWPVKHSTVNYFSVQRDLVKIRFHHSEKYQHIPVRIPKTEKNKDGTKPCKLCSEGKIRRKTTWMCATCEVPLCTRPLLDEGGQAIAHHARWHSCQNLIEEHKICHAELKNGRDLRKRARGGGKAEESIDVAGEDEALVDADEIAV